MLVLSRRLGEKIHIGKNVELTVLDISRGHIRLGINCPVQIPVHREEVYRRICASRNSVDTGDGDNSPLDVQFAQEIPRDQLPSFSI
jgi:carbon storage regulator